jgi:formylmethanofuran dehydrogenase subunit E
MNKDGYLSRNPEYEESKTYTIYCKMCNKEIGESETDDNGFAVCLDCYYK